MSVFHSLPFNISLTILIILSSCKPEETRPENNFAFAEITYPTTNLFYWNNGFGFHYLVIADGEFDEEVSILQNFTNIIYLQFYSTSTVDLSSGLYKYNRLGNNPAPPILVSGEVVIVNKGTFTVTDGMVEVKKDGKTITLKYELYTNSQYAIKGYHHGKYIVNKFFLED